MITGLMVITDDVVYGRNSGPLHISSLKQTIKF
mgnify:CR=1 FL=1